MKTEARKALETVNTNLEKLSTIPQEIEALIALQDSLVQELGEMKNDLVFFKKYLSEGDVEELGINEVIESIPEHKIEPENQKQSGINFPTLLKEIMKLTTEPITRKDLFEMMQQQMPELNYTDFSNKLRNQIKREVVLETIPDDAKSTKDRLIELVK